MFKVSKVSLLVLITSFLCLMLASGASANGVYPPGAKTPPPPDWDSGNVLYVTEGDSVNVSFETSAVYLDSAGTSLTNLGNGSVSVSGYTNATQRVDSIGVRVTLQLWTGSAWVDIFQSPSTTSSNSANVYYSTTRSVTGGQYYRVNGYHYLTQGTFFESENTTGTSYYIN